MADDKTTAKPDTPAAEGKADAPAARTSLQNREDSFLTVQMQPYSPGFLLSKKGLSVGYLMNPKWTFELEYLKGSFDLEVAKLDLVSFSETLISGAARWYPGTNSFHMIFGLGQRTFAFELGNTILSEIDTAKTVPIYGELMKVQNYVFEFGLANRWQFDAGFTLGADWLVMYIPFKGTVDAPIVDQITNENDRKNVNKTLHTLQYIPSLAYLEVNAGSTF